MTLRQQAVKAARLAAHESMDMEENLNTIASRAVTAAEPFLRDQVIAEVVEWLRYRSKRARTPYRWSQCVEIAGEIEREFGGKHA